MFSTLPALYNMLANIIFLLSMLAAVATKTKEEWWESVLETKSLKEEDNIRYVALIATIMKPEPNVGGYFQSVCTGTLIQRDLVLTVPSCLHGYSKEALRIDNSAITVSCLLIIVKIKFL